MKHTDERLEKIVKEELQKEGLFDFFKKKKPAPTDAGTGGEVDPRIQQQAQQKAYDAAIKKTAYWMSQRGMWSTTGKFEPHPKLHKLIGHTWFPREIEANRPRPWTGNAAAWQETLKKTFPVGTKTSIEFLMDLSDNAEESGVGGYQLPDDSREDEPLYQDVYGGGHGGRLASLSSMEESKTNDNMTSLMENWRKYEKKTLLIEQLNLNAQTSFKIFDGKPQLAAKVMQELLKGGDLFKQLQTAQGKFAVKSPELVQQWVDSIGGIEVFAKRAAALGSKIPDQGLAKKDMPFLPGPEDAQGNPSDVEDALKPGGKLNIDILEKTAPPAPNTFIGMKDPAAQDYMQAGLKDGDPNDDNIEIKMNGEFPAAKGIPTQTNILFPKALGMAMNGVKGGPIGAYASTEGHILDGHHRWAATMLNDPSANIGTFAMIDMNKAGMMDTLKHLTAIGNALGNKTKTK